MENCKEDKKRIHYESNDVREGSKRECHVESILSCLSITNHNIDIGLNLYKVNSSNRENRGITGRGRYRIQISLTLRRSQLIINGFVCLFCKLRK